MDRLYRTKQLIQFVNNNIKPDLLIVRGENLPEELNNAPYNQKRFSLDCSEDEVIEYIDTLDSHFIMGIGNIVGWGERFVSKIKASKI